MINKNDRMNLRDFYLLIKTCIRDEEYFQAAQEAMFDGLREENKKLRNNKSNVEVGFVVLYDMNRRKIKDRMKSVIKQAIESTTFINTESMLKDINEEIEDEKGKKEKEE